MTETLRWWHQDLKVGKAKLTRLSQYCGTDVIVARDLFKRVRRLNDTERDVWELDGKINNTGIFIDIEAVSNAKEVVDQALESADILIHRLTEGAVPKASNASALRKWLIPYVGNLESVDKATVRTLLARDDIPPIVRRVLQIRTDVGGSAVKKLAAMLACTNDDGRARGSHLYCGAATGRWSSKNIQLQNLIRNVMNNMDEVIEDFSQRNADYIEIIHGPAIGIVSRCLRGMIKAPDGHKLYVCDYSNVEGRAVAYLAGEESKLEAFRLADEKKGPGIYEVAAAGIYKVPVETITKDSMERQIGKISELSCLSGGQKVLTNIGLVPIEKITKKHLLWDGEEFVSHDGVICKGRRETIGYDGIRATDDHVVFTADGKMPLIEAVRKSIPLIGTGIAASTTSPDPRPYVTAKALVKSFGGKRLEMTYDILNAGPRNRFTCNGRLVSNCGYGGGAGAFSKMAKAYNLDIDEDMADDIKTAWRAANPNIVKLWKALEVAAIEATTNPGKTISVRSDDYPNVHPGVKFARTGGFLFMRLPSGRFLSYPNPRTRTEMVTFKYKEPGTGKKKTRTAPRTVLYCDATNSFTRKFEQTGLYSGLFAENLCQSFCRDLLAEAMLKLDAAGYKIVLHVHDEIVAEVPDGFGSFEEFKRIMCELPEWATGFPQKAAGDVTVRYKK